MTSLLADMIAKGRATVTPGEAMAGICDGDIFARYLGITRIPSLVNSPLREDRNPSFRLYSPDGRKILWKDFATGDGGDLYDLLGRLWNLGFPEVLDRIASEAGTWSPAGTLSCVPCGAMTRSRDTASLQVRVRRWMDHDLEYWGTFGISLRWLEWAEVYPISYKIMVINGVRYAFIADKYAYAFVERKGGDVSVKVYQPFNTSGFKWSSGSDGSVIGLWARLPGHGDSVCVCSSLKDALCLSASTGMRTVYLQGEGMGMSDSAVGELRRRFTNVFICFDNDSAGLLDAKRLAARTGFTNVVLPPFHGGKDIAEYYQQYGHEGMVRDILPLFPKAINQLKGKQNEQTGNLRLHQEA